LPRREIASMKNLSIYSKLVLILILPLLGIVFYTGMNARTHYHEWNDLSTTEVLMDMSTSLGDLIHTLQVERGSTAGFIQSNGVKFARELPEYRAATDKMLAKVKAEYARSQESDLPAAAKQQMELALDSLKMLESTRADASAFAIPAKEMAGRYTKAIATIQDVIPAIAEQSSDLTVTKLMTAYVGFLNLKERSGQERALLTGVFAVDKIEPAQYQALLGHIAAQNAYEHIFDDYATEELRAQYKKAADSKAFSDVDAMRNTVMAKSAEGLFGIDPTTWFATMTARIDAMHGIENELADKVRSFASEQADKAHFSLILNVAASIVILIVTLSLGYKVMLDIVRQVNLLHDTISRIQRDNDLTRRLEINSDDEIGRTARAFNLLIDSLQNSIKKVNESAGKVLQFSEMLASTSSQLSSSTAHQSEAASSMAAAVEEMTVSIEQVSENAKHVQDVSQSSSERSSEGSTVILQVTEDMQDIAEAVHASSVIMEELGQQSDQIYSIVQVIKDIADQTNLLALNAAIEAARAGEQGRGFAVVADEVRKLAERTTRSTEEIAAMIGKIQSGTKQAIGSLEVGVERVNREVELAQQAGVSIQQIQSGTEEVGQAVDGISSAIREQSAASTEIAKQVEKVAQMSEEISAATQTSSETALEMRALAQSLQGQVAQFKV
jgi:methyl-accepting chemotaxis protein